MKEISKLMEYRSDVKVVDATLRDGGLVNNFYFTDEFVKEVNIAAESVYNGDSSIIRNGQDILKALKEDLERAKANGNQVLEQVISEQIKTMDDYRGSKKGLDTMNKEPDYEKELLDYFKKQKKDN